MRYPDYEVVSFTDEVRVIIDEIESNKEVTEPNMKEILSCLLTLGEFVVKSGSTVVPNGPLSEAIRLVKKMVELRKEGLAQYFADSEEAGEAFKEIYISCMSGAYPRLYNVGSVDEGAFYAQRRMIREAFDIDYYVTQMQKKDIRYRFDNATQIASMNLQYNRLIPRYMVLLTSGQPVPFSLSFFEKMIGLFQKIEKNYRGPMYVERDSSLEAYFEKQSVSEKTSNSTNQK